MNDMLKHNSLFMTRWSGKFSWLLYSIVCVSIGLSSCQSDTKVGDSDDIVNDRASSDGAIPDNYDVAIDRPAEKLDPVESLDKERSHQSELSKQDQVRLNAEYPIRQGDFDSFLVGNWTYDITVKVTEDEADVSQKGNILQIHADYTFDIWSGDDIVQTGNFTYDRNQATLRLIPVNGQASEWKISYLRGSAIFVGTATFGNNSDQMRLYEGVRK